MHAVDDKERGRTGSVDVSADVRAYMKIDFKLKSESSGVDVGLESKGVVTSKRTMRPKLDNQTKQLYVVVLNAETSMTTQQETIKVD